jgi:putative membrane protein
MSSKKYHIILLVTASAFWVWSGIGPRDSRLTWVLETLPVIIALPVMLLTYRRFRLTDLTYFLIAIHAVILMEGGHYSYAKVPLGFWMEHWFGWTRNNYDKIGHFMQGFGPAIYTREIMARTSPLKRGGWLAFVSVAVPLAFSACTRSSNGQLPFSTRRIQRPFLEHRAISGTRKATCCGV